MLKGDATTVLAVVAFSSPGSEEDLSSSNKKKGSKKKAVDRSQAIVKWAGGEAASTGVSAAMVAAGITTLVAPTVAVREREREASRSRGYPTLLSSAQLNLFIPLDLHRVRSVRLTTRRQMRPAPVVLQYLYILTHPHCNQFWTD